MRIVLLGATGFVGRHLLPLLTLDGHQCVVLTRYAPGCRDLMVTPGVELCQANIFDRDALIRHFEGAGAVINLVGILNESGRKGKGFQHVHVDLVDRVIAACRATSVPRIIHMSALNAGKGTSHYLASKGRAEELLRNADDIATTIVQPSVIFGEGDAFFNRFAALLRLAPVLPLACADSKMQPVWVGDVSAAIAAALEEPSTFGKTLVMVGPEKYSLRQLVEYTAKAAGLKRKVIGLPDSISRLQGLLMDFVPGKPFSSDNYRSLQIDNTSDNNSLPQFGIQPRSVASIVPGYLSGSSRQHRLDRFRKLAGR